MPPITRRSCLHSLAAAPLLARPAFGAIAVPPSPSVRIVLFRRGSPESKALRRRLFDAALAEIWLVGSVSGFCKWSWDRDYAPDMGLLDASGADARIEVDRMLRGLSTFPRCWLAVALDAHWAGDLRTASAVDAVPRGVVLHAGGGDYFRSPPMRCGQPDPAGLVHLGFGSNACRLAAAGWTNRCEAVVIDAAGKRRRCLALDRRGNPLDVYSFG